MEYATRDQAQQAVNTLSNQNLMGRLVYVREVRNPVIGIMRQIVMAKRRGPLLNAPLALRIAKPNPVSPAHLAVVAVMKDLQLGGALATVVVTADHLREETRDRSLSITFVSQRLSHFPRCFLEC